MFVRDTDLYKSTNIFKATFVEGVTEVLAMETMSVMPVYERVVMASALVPRRHQGFASRRSTHPRS